LPELLVQDSAGTAAMIGIEGISLFPDIFFRTRVPGRFSAMTADDIKRIINDELKSEPDIKNVFGLDLTKTLIVPTMQKYWDSADKKSFENLWTVLAETPDKKGYVIYFDEQSKMFGLGIQSGDELFDMGNYGTFLETLYSM
jgi:hypothetical protein